MSSHRDVESINLSEYFKDAEVNVASKNTNNERHLSKKYSIKKTTKGILGSVAIVTGGALFLGGVGYTTSVSKALAFKSETIGKVVDSGKAEIFHVSMKIPPITLATADTKVSGVKVAFEHKLTGLFNVSLGSDSLTRDANVSTHINIDPGKVNIDYDSKKEKLTFSALDTALSTEVAIPLGESRTVDKTGNLFLLPAEMLSKVSEAVDGTFGTDKSKVPIVREIAAGTLNIDQGLEKYADLIIVTQTDSECTPLIPEKIKDFTLQLKNNIRTVVKGQLLDPEILKNDVSSALMNMPLSKIQKLVENSTVEIPENFTIGPDQSNIAKLDDYKKSKLLSSTVDAKKPMVCGVSEDTKLSLLDKTG